MAERRMYSNRIVNSAKFIKMPISTQALYFHLGIHADDDGIVEAYQVMRSIGATEDDLRILSLKSYIIILNEDLVSYITDWNEHNKIRADRKIDSIYKNLLLQIVPEAKIIKMKDRSDTKNSRIEGAGPSMARPWTRNGPHRIGKDRLGKVSIVSNTTVLSNNNNNNIYSEYNFSKCVIEILDLWFAYKKEKKSEYKPTGLKTFLKKIQQEIERIGEQNVISVFEKSMSMNWQGLFFDKIEHLKTEKPIYKSVVVE